MANFGPVTTPGTVRTLDDFGECIDLKIFVHEIPKQSTTQAYLGPGGRGFPESPGIT